ncbi:MAG: hypothetical protein QMC78_03465 [Methanocellales archaeon]|nr:hypothetical protein [Methanocellales archaeon]
MMIVRRDVDDVILFFDLEKKEIHVSTHSKKIDMSEVVGGDITVPTISHADEKVWREILSGRSNERSQSNEYTYDRADIIAEELCNTTAARVLMVFPDKNVMITDKDIEERMGWQSSMGVSVNTLSRYNLIEKGEKIGDGFYWHITDLGTKVQEKLKTMSSPTKAEQEFHAF